MNISYAMIFVSDMSRSVAFYRDVVGLPLKFESTEWTEFATEGATLALHRTDVPQATTAPKAAGLCRPGISVPNLARFHERMQQAGIPCTQPPRDVYGTQIAQYTDPDGLEFSVSEIRSGA